jgi:hypothetical protein
MSQLIRNKMDLSLQKALYHIVAYIEVDFLIYIEKRIK